MAGARSSCPRQRAVFFPRRLKAQDGAGHADGQIAGGAGTLDDLALAVEIHGLGGGERCAFAEIEEGGLAVFQPDGHEPAAADIASGWIDDGQRITDGHRRIDGIAALLQYLDADVGSEMLGGDDHAMFGLDGLGRGRCRRVKRQERNGNDKRGNRAGTGVRQHGVSPGSGFRIGHLRRDRPAMPAFAMLQSRNRRSLLSCYRGGMTLPGFMMPLGSSAVLMRRMTPISASLRE